jgi:uncharacterized membrane protein
LMIGSERLNRRLSLVLRAGMWLSFCTLLLGLIWYAAAPVPDEVIPVEDLVSQMSSGNPIALLELGILMLIATPFLRLLTALAAFIHEKDVNFVIVSLFVILVVTIGIVVKL